ncbi:hypothetical protein OEA41_000452 [Lepraria neglecta]|uniref:Uncharacterized protein n=1 Tax=Lepraria neglecta TaxID=209136 RepID=A0AAD9ZFP3_9LECA|nr:hypothetical protein OEA41_000452 [Lepraria neglecta]
MGEGPLEKERSVKLSTYGIIFMGTPRQGGQGVSVGKIMLNVAKIQGHTRTAKVIVPKWSAVVPGTSDAAEFGISEDYRRMTKFPNAESTDFKKIARTVAAMIDKAGAKIQSNWECEAREKEATLGANSSFNIRGAPLVKSYVERHREMRMMEVSSASQDNYQQIRYQLDQVIEEVLDWFSKDGNTNWLLIYDNVDRDNSAEPDDPEAFDEFVRAFEIFYE